MSQDIKPITSNTIIDAYNNYCRFAQEHWGTTANWVGFMHLTEHGTTHHTEVTNGVAWHYLDAKVAARMEALAGPHAYAMYKTMRAQET